MNQFSAVLLCAVIRCVGFVASDSGYKVKYDGGSVPNIKAGNDVKLFIEDKQIRMVKDKKDVALISAASITEVSYRQDVHRRVGAAIGIGLVSFGIGALMALSKSNKHFIGIT